MLAPVGLILLLSLLPYLLPVRALEGSPADLVFNNSRFHKGSGVELHYRIWNPAGEKPRGSILLVHGFGGSTFTWRHTAPYLADQGFHVIAVDLPGFGLSERVTGFEHTAEHRAAHLWTLLNELGPTNSWHLVGHSMGGATVAAMALQDSDRVDSLTLAAGAVLDRDPGHRTNLLLRYPPAQRLIKVLSTHFIINPNRLEQLLASAYGRNPTGDEVEGYSLPLNIRGTELVLAELIQSGVRDSSLAVTELMPPVLCLWGEEDSWVPLTEGHALKEVIPGSDLAVIQGEGHCPMETAPEQFNLILVNFIGGHSN